MASRKFLSVLDWEFFFSLSLVLARLTIIDLENRKCCGYRDLPFCNFVYEVNSLRLFRISR